MTHQYQSGAPAAEAMRSPIPQYRTHALIFLWSSTSAAYGSRAPTYARRRSRTRWCQIGKLMHAAWATALILEIHFMIKDSCKIKDSTTGPYGGLRLFVEVMCF